MCLVPIGQRQQKDRAKTVATQGSVILGFLASSTELI